MTVNEDGTTTYHTAEDGKPKVSDLFPEVNYFLHRPLIANPPMCELRHLDDGTYSIDDLLKMHTLLDLKEYITPSSEPQQVRIMNWQ